MPLMQTVGRLEQRIAPILRKPGLQSKRLSKQKLDWAGEGTGQANRREEEMRVEVRREKERWGETSGPSQSHS